MARYSTAGLLGVYDDIMHLAEADLLVGTFSSQVSRLAYEVKLVNATAPPALLRRGPPMLASGGSGSGGGGGGGVVWPLRGGGGAAWGACI